MVEALHAAANASRHALLDRVVKSADQQIHQKPLLDRVVKSADQQIHQKPLLDHVVKSADQQIHQKPEGICTNAKRSVNRIKHGTKST
jgi:hypothetical protein